MRGSGGALRAFESAGGILSARNALHGGGQHRADRDQSHTEQRQGDNHLEQGEAAAFEVR